MSLDITSFFCSVALRTMSSRKQMVLLKLSLKDLRDYLQGPLGLKNILENHQREESLPPLRLIM